MKKGKSIKNDMEQVKGILDANTLTQIQAVVEQVQVHDHVYSYICKLVQSTRENSYIELGISPRGTLACVRMAKAWAYLSGRAYVLPKDVVDIFKDVAKHRIVLNTKARVAKVSEAAVLDEILAQVRQPASYMQKAEYRV